MINYMNITFLDKANIKRLGLNYLLKKIPTDEESIIEIAKICKYYWIIIRDIDEY